MMKLLLTDFAFSENSLILVKSGLHSCRVTAIRIPKDMSPGIELI